MAKAGQIQLRPNNRVLYLPQQSCAPSDMHKRASIDANMCSGRFLAICHSPDVPRQPDIGPGLDVEAHVHCIAPGPPKAALDLHVRLTHP